MKKISYKIKNYNELKNLLIELSHCEQTYKTIHKKKFSLKRFIPLAGIIICLGIPPILDKQVENNDDYSLEQDNTKNNNNYNKIVYEKDNNEMDTNDNEKTTIEDIDLNEIDDENIVEIKEKQTGITANNTNYEYYYDKWNNSSNQRVIADAWNEEGRNSDRGIATLDGKYLVAMTNTFGNVGDSINIILEDGTIIPCIIADIKGDDASVYGHYLTLPSGNVAVDVVEWEAVVNKEEIQLKEWKKQKVKCVIKNKNLL